MTKGFRLKNAVMAAGLGLLMLVIGSSEASAQSRREIERERQRIERQNARYQREQRRNNDRYSSATTARTERRIANANYASGYEQGFIAGEFDRRKGKYNRSNVYRDTGSYPNEGDPTSNDYIYRQGYLQGYNDGFNGIRNY